MNQGYIKSKSYDIIPKKCVSPIWPLYKKLEQPQKSHRELTRKWDFATKADAPIKPLKYLILISTHLYPKSHHFLNIIDNTAIIDQNE